MIGFGREVALSDANAIRLGDIAERVPGMTAASKARLGCAPDPSLPARFLSLEDFDNGMLRAVGGAYMDAPPAPGSARGRRTGRASAGDLCFSRVGGRFVGLIQDDFGKELSCSENIITAHLDDASRPAAAVIARWLALGADGQMERVAVARGASASWDAIASILVPGSLLQSPPGSALEEALKAYCSASGALGEAQRQMLYASLDLDAAVVQTAHRLNLPQPEAPRAHGSTETS